MKKEKEEAKDKYQWLEQANKRRNISGREILDKYINLDKSCLSDSDKKQVIDMLYEYKDTFSFTDEIGTSPNLEVEIDITDKSSFFIRPYQVREGDKKGNEKTVLFRYTKGRFSAYLSPFMLISRKVTKDMRVVTILDI